MQSSMERPTAARVKQKRGNVPCDSGSSHRALHNLEGRDGAGGPVTHTADPC